MSKDSVFIHPTAEVHPSASIGPGTRIWNGVQVRENAVIGEHCSFGKDTYVDANVHIGARVRVQNGVSIYQGVRIDDDVFVGPHVCFTNDLYPRAFNRDWQLTPTRVHSGASLGAGVTIVCGVTVGAYALAAVGAVVTKDVPPYALVMGNPARLKGWVCRCGRPFPGGLNVRGVPQTCGHCAATLTPGAA
jgi:UDP-2-acetamido-3-amino-2,3-dideoxy-glucuronate N-acetyltransferase